MMNIKTRMKLEQLKKKSIDAWYFCMKPLAYLFDKIDKHKQYGLKHRRWSDRKIKRELNKQIQKIVIYHSKYNGKSFFISNTYIYDIQDELSNAYNVQDLFYYSWKRLRNKYLSKYYWNSKEHNSKDSEFIEKWLPVILELCKKNGLKIKEINKYDMCPKNEYWKYDRLYKRLDKVWEVKFNV